jgi:hypothetical protein
VAAEQRHREAATRSFIGDDTMNTAHVTNPRPCVGRIVTALPVLFLLFDSVIKFTNIAPVVE